MLSKISQKSNKPQTKTRNSVQTVRSPPSAATERPIESNVPQLFHQITCKSQREKTKKNPLDNSWKQVVVVAAAEIFGWLDGEEIFPPEDAPSIGHVRNLLHSGGAKKKQQLGLWFRVHWCREPGGFCSNYISRDSISDLLFQSRYTQALSCIGLAGDRLDNSAGNLREEQFGSGDR